MNTYSKHHSIIKHLLWLIVMINLLIPAVVWAKTPVFEIYIRDHLFYPSTVSIPAHTKVKLLVINEDPTAEEFESYELNREKVIAGKRKAVIFIGPLAAGNYPFFGEFHPNTAQGNVVVE